MPKQIRGALKWAYILAVVTLWPPAIVATDMARRDPARYFDR